MLNAADTLRYQLSGLAQQTYPGAWEVVIADNGSTDDSVKVAGAFEDRLPRLRVVDASGRRGVSHARNIGARAARGDLILICDADDVVAPNWIESMARAAQSYDVFGGGVDSSPPDSFALVGEDISPRAALPCALGFLPYAVGANCGVWAEVFHALGGWNEDYVSGSDDIDFSWRAQLASFCIGYAPDAFVHYRQRANLRGYARRVHSYGISHARLYRDYRPCLERCRLTHALRTWAWIVAHAGDLLSGNRRKFWVQVAASRFGRLRGSLRYRVLYL